MKNRILIVSEIADRISDLIPFKGNKIFVYGAGYYGKLLISILEPLGANYSIVDDNDGESMHKLDLIDIPASSILVLTVYDHKIRNTMREKAVSAGFKHIIDDPKLFVEIDNSIQYLGYIKANKSNVSVAGCPICFKDAYEIYVNHKDFSIRECSDCGHIYVANITKAQVDDFYDDIGYFEQNYKVDLQDFFNEKLTEVSKNRVEMISPFLTQDIKTMPPINFLELGCLDGRLLWYLKRFGHNVFGSEVNAHVAKVGIEKLGVDIRIYNIDECGFEDNFFDLIFSSHVLEHLMDPIETMKSSYKLLKPGGMFIANLPCNENDYENFHHLHFFTNESILQAMKSVFSEVTSSEGFQYAANDKLFDTINVCGKKY